MTLTKKDFAKKFDLTIKYLCPSNEDHIKKGIQKKGYNLIKCNWDRENTTFEIEPLNSLNTEEEWKPFPLNPDYLVSTLGRVKNSQGILLQGTNNHGYQRVSIKGFHQLGIHRMVMQTFSPIQDDNLYSVDHINGIRNDNRLENLRWVFQSDNCKNFDENNTLIKEIIPKLIQKFGYEITKQKIEKLLDE